MRLDHVLFSSPGAASAASAGATSGTSAGATSSTLAASDVSTVTVAGTDHRGVLATIQLR